MDIQEWNVIGEEVENRYTGEKILFGDFLELCVEKGYYIKEIKEQKIYLKENNIFKTEKRMCTVYSTSK